MATISYITLHRTKDELDFRTLHKEYLIVEEFSLRQRNHVSCSQDHQNKPPASLTGSFFFLFFKQNARLIINNSKQNPSILDYTVSPAECMYMYN